MTTVLMVRHGQTPTTGKVLPGRAPNLHLGDVGIAQAERAAARIFRGLPTLATMGPADRVPSLSDIADRLAA